VIEVLPTRLPDVRLLRPPVHVDPRGFFLEAYHRDAYAAAGVDVEFVQDNHSRSVHRTLRGLHYQAHPGQPKLVRTARGAIFDVVVDIRPDSATFGQYETFELDDVGHLQVYVPVGFAHGFCVVSDVADVVYKVGSYYDPLQERGIAWDDPEIGIAWPVTAPLLSERDRTNPSLAEAIGRGGW
jgi:dTDP-4-dehydrorhamnose 3,5-epimerase